MDELAKEDIRKILIGVKQDELTTVVLGIQNDLRGSQQGGRLDHSRFSSRIEMRKALVNREVSVNSDAIGSAFLKLTGLGLKISPGSLTGTVTVRGTPEQLRAAINEPFVDSAVVDFQIGLIQPKRGGEVD